MFPTFELPPFDTLIAIKMSAPQQPINTPNAFCVVIGSFQIRADMISAKMGMVVVTMPAFMGEVRLKPMV